MPDEFVRKVMGISGMFENKYIYSILVLNHFEKVLKARMMLLWLGKGIGSRR